ncbi:MAG: DUF2029 domain-containing protein, partial [Vicinamibacteria bacterium]|nr:DUF2029 domain-containing protein [Vicinamibacteria bacterium]
MIADATLRRILPASTVALLGDLIRWCTWAGVAVVWASFARAYFNLWVKTATQPGKNDYSIFYYTAHMVRDGLPMYGPVPAAYGFKWPVESLGNLNPPHFALLTAPFWYLSYQQAFVLWLASGLVCLVLSLRIVWQELQYPRSLRLMLVVGAAVLSFAPFVLVASTGELTYFLLLPLTLGWRAARRGRWGAAGIWLGACASVKLFLLLFLPWLLLQRRWRAAAAFVLTIAVMVAMGAALFGVDSYWQWRKTLAIIGWWGLPMNASFAGLVHRVWTTGAANAQWLAAVGGGVIAVATLACLRAPAAGPRQVDTGMAGVLLGALLASPLGWAYYVPLLLGPLLGCLDALWRGRAGRWWWPAVVVAGVFLYVPDEVIGAWHKVAWQAGTVGSLYFWALLLLWVTALGWYGRRQQGFELSGEGPHHGGDAIGHRAEQLLAGQQELAGAPEQIDREHYRHGQSRQREVGFGGSARCSHG